MIAGVLLAGAYLLANSGSFDLPLGRENLSKQSNPSISRSRVPTLVRDDIDEKSFAANQPHHSIRNPFGPNPDTKTVNAFEMINWPAYRTRYTGNLHRLTVLNHDWRLDPSFNSSLNNYSNVHMAENYPALISNSAGNSSTPAPDFEQWHRSAFAPRTRLRSAASESETR